MSNNKKGKNNSLAQQSQDEEFVVLKTVIVYDKLTGRILETHRYSGLAGSTPNVDEDVVLANAIENAMSVERASDQDPKNLKVMLVDNDELPLAGRKMIDVGSNKLTELPELKVQIDKKELDGDGKDETEIQVHAVDKSGATIHGFNGTVKVSTSRGKLSNRGGLVKLTGGRGSITLRSVNETVNRVRVEATSIDTPSQRGRAQLSFM